MDNLQQILNQLEQLQDTFQGNYFIPEDWIPAGFVNSTRRLERGGAMQC